MLYLTVVLFGFVLAVQEAYVIYRPNHRWGILPSLAQRRMNGVNLGEGLNPYLQRSDNFATE
jgi:hypothetical protein